MTEILKKTTLSGINGRDGKLVFVEDKTNSRT